MIIFGTRAKCRKARIDILLALFYYLHGYTLLALEPTILLLSISLKGLDGVSGHGRSLTPTQGTLRSSVVTGTVRQERSAVTKPEEGLRTMKNQVKSKTHTELLFFCLVWK